MPPCLPAAPPVALQRQQRGPLFRRPPLVVSPYSASALPVSLGLFNGRFAWTRACVAALPFSFCASVLFARLRRRMPSPRAPLCSFRFFSLDPPSSVRCSARRAKNSSRSESTCPPSARSWPVLTSKTRRCDVYCFRTSSPSANRVTSALDAWGTW